MLPLSLSNNICNNIGKSCIYYHSLTSEMSLNEAYLKQAQLPRLIANSL